MVGKIYNLLKKETMDFKLQELNKSHTYKNFTSIGIRNKKHYIYKYMNAERALEFISTKNLCFVEPTLWNDPYENRFYIADYSNLQHYQPPQQIYATCTTLDQSSEAAWKVYSSENKGLASRCILFKFRRSLFIKELNQFATNNNYEFFEGKANYLFYDSIIDNLHLKENNPNYNYFFKEFNLEKYLNLLLIKRQAFEYENELRYFFIKNSKTSDNKIFISFENLDLIEEIWYDKDCSEFEIKLIKKVCLENNIKKSINKFNLYEYDKNIKIKIDSPI